MEKEKGKENVERTQGRRKKSVLVAVLAALLAVSLANAAVIVFQKTVQITVGEPVVVSPSNWLPNTQSVSPGQNVNYTTTVSNIGPNPYNVEIAVYAVSNAPKGTIRLYLNGSLVLTAFFDNNATSKTYTISPFVAGTNYAVRLNLDIPSDSAAGSVNMSVTVTRL